MTRMKEKIFRTALALLALAAAAALWSAVALPYQNPHQIAGVLATQAFHPLTNVLRFSMFVALPSAAWMAAGRVLGADRRAWQAPRSIAEPATSFGAPVLAAVTALGLVTAMGEALHLLRLGLGSRDFDFFHDGDVLVPAFDWIRTGGLWTKRFLTHGAGHDVIWPWLGWRAFGRESIGAYKATFSVLQALVPLFLAGFVWCLQRALRDVASRVERTLLVALTAAVLVTGWQRYFWFNERALPVFVTLGAMVIAIGSGARGMFLAAGALGAVTLATTRDFGCYAILACVLAVGAFSFGKRRKEVRHTQAIPWAIGFGAGLVAVLALAGPREFAAWMDQIVASATRWDFVYATIYPSPLLPSTWTGHAVPLVTLALLLLCFVSQWPRYRSELRLGQIHLLLVGMGVVSFRTGLGRSDWEHVVTGFGFAALAIGFSVWTFARWAPGRARTGLLALACLPMLAAAPSFGGPGGLWRELRSYAVEPDTAFLSERQERARRELARLTAHEPCLFVFTTEPAWYYLLQKPPCGRFFFSLHIMGTDYEQEVERSLEAARPRYVIYSSVDALVVDGIPIAERLERLDAWIRARYTPYAVIEGRMVLERVDHRASSRSTSRSSGSKPFSADRRTTRSTAFSATLR